MPLTFGDNRRLKALGRGSPDGGAWVVAQVPTKLLPPCLSRKLAAHLLATRELILVKPLNPASIYIGKALEAKQSLALAVFGATDWPAHCGPL
jgi:hypothetical protein